MLSILRKSTLALLFAGIAFPAFAQTKMGNNQAAIHPSALLELESTTKGFLPPRMLLAQINAIASPAKGLIIYCLDCAPKGVRIYNGTDWVGIDTTPVATYVVNSLNCGGNLAGTYQQGIPVTATNTKTVTITVATTGTYTATTSTANGVTFSSGGTHLSTGPGTAVTLKATGTPAASGTFTYFLSLGGQICSFDVTYTGGAVFSCGSATNTFTPAGELTPNVSYGGTYTLPYKSGNGSSYGAISFTEDGLTFTRTPGTYAAAGGNVVYTLSGTYTGTEAVNFFTTPEGCVIRTPSLFVSTFAGSTFPGYKDDTGTKAEFKFPIGLELDGSGNMYISELGNNRIRKITPTGTVSTFAGSGLNGLVNGTGTAARFQGLGGIAIDAGGNLYVTEANNNTVRKITPSGVVTTFAGNGTAGFVNGTGTAARFDAPGDLTIDGSGNLYVADESNHAIRKITPSGVVTTVAGNGTAGFVNGTGTTARFNFPRGITIDAGGNLYVSDGANHAIRKITPSGNVTTVAGNGTPGSTNGQGFNARFYFPEGLALDASGNIYVADVINHSIRKITPTGFVTTLVGIRAGFSNGTKAVAQFNQPHDVTVDANGNIYVADRANHAIRKITP